MRHAGADALARIPSLLEELREQSALVERRPGIFYRQSRAFLHFHEDASGIFADLRVAGDWLRFPVSTRAQQRSLLRRVDGLLQPPASR